MKKAYRRSFDQIAEIDPENPDQVALAEKHGGKPYAPPSVEPSGKKISKKAVKNEPEI